MASLTLRLPRSTHDQLKALAKQEGVSINQLVLTAVAEKISAVRSIRLFESRLDGRPYFLTHLYTC